MTPPPRDEETSPVVVMTTGGAVRGQRRAGTVFFGGIPYAEPPTKALRFAAPIRRRAWSGILDRRLAAPGAPQRPGALARLIGMACPDQDEDCLHVSLWTPSCSADARRPVLVWIHGGAFEAGAASNPLADGARLSRRGDVVVVSVGYRLGVPGFLSLEGGPNNRGLLDQAAALEWVKDNVAAFGGDPDNVTIFGSSAGATCVAALLATHGQRGLFRRAVVQSGTAEGVATPDAMRELRAELFFHLGIRERDPARMRELLQAVPEGRLLRAQRAAGDHLRRQGVLLPLQLVLDEETLPVLPLAAIHGGSARGVDLFVGTNRDELRLWILGEAPRRIDDAASLEGHLSRLLGGGGGGSPEVMRIVEKYREVGGAEDLTDVFYAIATDLCFRLPAIRLATAQSRHASVYSYLFAWKAPAFGGRLGAPHSIEIPFLFGTHERFRMAFFLGAGPDRRALSQRVADIWAAFATRGDPSVPGFSWPRFTSSDRATGVISDALAVARPAWADEVRIWEPVWRTRFAVAGVDDAAPSQPRSIPPQPSLER